MTSYFNNFKILKRRISGFMSLVINSSELLVIGIIGTYSNNITACLNCHKFVYRSLRLEVTIQLCANLDLS